MLEEFQHLRDSMEASMSAAYLNAIRLQGSLWTEAKVAKLVQGGELIKGRWNFFQRPFFSDWSGL
jgi:hypothetical protein